MKTKLTVEQIDLALAELMLEQPDFIYPDNDGDECRYHEGPGINPEKCSGCIIGQALQRLGVGERQLETAGAICAANIDALPEIEERPDRWRITQGLQDEGTPWGSLLHHLPADIVAKAKTNHAKK